MQIFLNQRIFLHFFLFQNFNIDIVRFYDMINLVFHSIVFIHNFFPLSFFILELAAKYLIVFNSSVDVHLYFGLGFFFINKNLLQGDVQNWRGFQPSWPFVFNDFYLELFEVDAYSVNIFRVIIDVFKKQMKIFEDFFNLLEDRILGVVFNCGLIDELFGLSFDFNLQVL